MKSMVHNMEVLWVKLLVNPGSETRLISREKRTYIKYNIWTTWNQKICMICFLLSIKNKYFIFSDFFSFSIFDKSGF